MSGDGVSGDGVSKPVDAALAREFGLSAEEYARVLAIQSRAPTLTELEFERESEAEIFFVPIRTGTFLWRCRGMETRGMAGSFIVK